MNRFARVLAAAAMIAATLAVAAPAAHAADPRLRLLAQPAWSSIGGSTTLQLDIPPAQLPPDTDVTLRLRLYSRVTTMDDFNVSVTGAELSGRLATRRIELADLTRDANGAVPVALGIGRSEITPTLPVSGPGVYPLEVALEVDGDETLASFVTWIVAVDPADAGATVPLRVAWVWTVVAPPLRGVDGEPDPEVAREFAPGGRLDGITSLIATGGGMPVTLQIGPETLEGWGVLAQSDPTVAAAYERVVAAAARPTTELLVAPYVPIDLAALEAAGLGDELPNQLVVGSDALEPVAGVRPDPRTVLVDPVDAAVLTRLRGLLVDQVVVRDSQFVTVDATPPLQPFELRAGNGTMRAVAATSIVDQMLTGSDPAALRAHRALAALSLLALDDPTQAGAVVIAPPGSPAPDVDRYGELIGAMRSHPLFNPTTLSDIFANVPAAAGEPPLELVPIEPGALPISGLAYLTAKTSLASLQSSVTADNPAVVQGGRALSLALSTEQSTETAQRQLSVIDDGVEQLSAGVGTTPKRITLTSRRADVPLSFRNDTGQPVKATVHLDSTKLLFPDGDNVTIELPPGNSTHRFAVEARTSGTFTMTVTLTTPDGKLTIGPPTKVTVRSAVFSGVGAAITVGALIFLALWWGNHFRRSRRARAAVEHA